ncbi:hypothetical protein [Vreelandella alkaliphila]|uniref:hypothetical protein n=1 Tax=Vreelandella alkaliphila TaxID=272774 RepID=UPI003FD72C58
MTELPANIRLRPTRIGFLVRPSDRKSVRKIMRINACLWGGQYNPIIPVFRHTPKDWKEEHFKSPSGKKIVGGYVKFFEPDIYVEAEVGLLEKAGLGILRGNNFDKNSISLEQFFEQEHRGVFEPYFGQSAFDIINDTYLDERRFQLRDPHPAIYTNKKNDVFAELCLGVFPELKNLKHIKAIYHDVYRPERVSFTPEVWLKVYSNECVTPFSAAAKNIDIEQRWYDDPVIYIFDPSKTTDLIDLWNIRIQPSSIYPVPIEWVSDLHKPLCRFIENNFRPLNGNSNGVMHKTTIEISRSITEEYAREEILPFFKETPQGSLVYKFWRTPIWNVDYRNNFVQQPERVKLTASKKDVTLSIKDGGYLHTEFETLSPHFADRFSGTKKRWANVITTSSNYMETNVATCLPYNTSDRNWPFKGLGAFSIGREGWVYLQDYKESKQHVSLLKQDESFFKWFEYKGLSVSLSEAGRIAKQLIDSVGGLWGLYLFDDVTAIKFINKLANSTRTRKSAANGDVIEEDFSGKVASITEWQKMISKRKAQGAHHRVTLSDYIERNVVRIGLETDCSHCYAKNWHDLDEVSYQIKCSRCLKRYDFPQGSIKNNNQNWKYRVVGPFAVPDFAQGAYASLLTIRFFTRFRNRDASSCYSTAAEIKHNGRTFEVDFAVWASDESGFDINPEPRLIIGEAKSFALDAVKEKDLEQLKEAAALLPGSVLVISVLKESFSDEEIERLNRFVEWSRESSSYGPKHWVILLTGIELFDEFLENNWKKKGPPHSIFSDYNSTRSIESLSDSTLNIYLDQKPYHEWHAEK